MPTCSNSIKRYDIVQCQGVGRAVERTFGEPRRPTALPVGTKRTHQPNRQFLWWSYVAAPYTVSERVAREVPVLAPGGG